MLLMFCRVRVLFWAEPESKSPLSNGDGDGDTSRGHSRDGDDEHQLPGPTMAERLSFRSKPGVRLFCFVSILRPYLQQWAAQDGVYSSLGHEPSLVRDRLSDFPSLLSLRAFCSKFIIHVSRAWWCEGHRRLVSCIIWVVLLLLDVFSQEEDRHGIHTAGGSGATPLCDP